MSAPSCFVCEGKDCARAGSTGLRHELAEAGVAVTAVRCQKICKGPVAGIEVQGRIEWFGRLRGRKARRDLRRLVKGHGVVTERLATRRSAKRSGRLRL